MTTAQVILAALYRLPLDAGRVRRVVEAMGHGNADATLNLLVRGGLVDRPRVEWGSCVLTPRGVASAEAISRQVSERELARLNAIVEEVSGRNRVDDLFWNWRRPARFFA